MLYIVLNFNAQSIELVQKEDEKKITLSQTAASNIITLS